LVQLFAKKSFTLNEYLSRSYIDQLQAADMSPDLHAALVRTTNWYMGSPSEFRVAQRIQALDPLGKKIHLYTARNYEPDLIRKDNVIVLGSGLSNPWHQLLERHLNFVANSDVHSAVVNYAPAPGEQQIYTTTPAVKYCVVDYLPSPDHNGKVLLIESIGSEGVEAAADFLLSEDQLSNFQKTLHVTTLPYFEVLLKTSAVVGSPFTVTIEAYRTYPNLH
jgi:hypothetical protein